MENRAREEKEKREDSVSGDFKTLGRRRTKTKIDNAEKNDLSIERKVQRNAVYNWQDSFDHVYFLLDAYLFLYNWRNVHQCSIFERCNKKGSILLRLLIDSHYRNR
ncbi:hypothetical protein ACOME3_007699 [Neoechinorhynchus agilis]